MLVPELERHHVPFTLTCLRGAQLIPSYHRTLSTVMYLSVLILGCSRSLTGPPGHIVNILQVLAVSLAAIELLVFLKKDFFI